MGKISNDRGPLVFRGGARRLLECQASEVVLSGSAGTGKSVAAATKLHYLCSMVPGMRCLICRKTRESLTETGLVTFEERVVAEGHPILQSGGQRRMRQSYQYPNGSSIVVGGMDKATRVMSSEYDLVYVQEAIELLEADWEALLTRLRNGKLPYQQLLADTNPDAPTHWLKKRCDSGRCLMLDSRHEDNPALHDGRGYTPFGLSYLAKLDALTGPRKLRLRYGRWVQAEGVVYEGWDRAVHLIDRFEIPLDWPRYWAIDFGYTEPFVCLMAARDHDGRLYVYRQVYKTKRLVEDHARHLKAMLHQEAEAYADRLRVPVKSALDCLRPRAIVCDHDAEGRATLERHLELGTTPAYKARKEGIEAVASRLKVAGDGKPRLLVLRDSLVARDQDLVEASAPTCLEDEVDGYVWSDTKQDEPIPHSDHSMDSLRYLVAHLDLRRGLTEAASSMPNPPRPSLADREPSFRPGDAGGRGSRLFGR